MKETAKRPEGGKKNILRRGFTLVELVIVMALLTVVSGVIVTFSVMMSNQMGLNSTRVDFLDSAAMLRSKTITDFSKIDGKDITFFVRRDGQTVIKVYSGSAEGSMTVDAADYDGIDEIGFEIIGGEERSGLLKITVKNTAASLEQSFTVYSRTGAVFTHDINGAV